MELTADVLPDNAVNKSVIWTSSSPNIASVDQDGVVTGLSPGVVKIRATASNNIFSEIAIKVKEKAQEPEPDPDPGEETQREWIKVNENDTSIDYTGTWVAHNDYTRYYMGDVKYSNSIESSASFTFNGTGIRYYSSRQYNAGFVDIYIDDVLVAESIDLYNEVHTSSEPIFSKEDLSDGEHIIKIVVKGEKNQESQGAYVLLDLFEYFGRE